MKKETKGFLVIGAVLVVVVAGALFWRICLYHLPEEYALKHWEDVCTKVDNERVLSSKIVGNNDGYDVEHDIDIKNCLDAEDFNRCLDKDVSTPTSDYIITIVFSDNSELKLNNWGEDTFSIYYRKRYYEVINPELYSRIQTTFIIN